jgi:hypothetical protein
VRYAISSMAVILAAFAAPSQAQGDRWLDRIDPYADGGSSPPAARETQPQGEFERLSAPTARERPATQPAKPRTPAAPVLEGPSGALGNRQAQEAHRDKILQLYEAIPKVEVPPNPPTPAAPPITEEKTRVRFSERKVSLRWGAEESGYEYVGYEFVFDALDPAHADRLTKAIQRIAQEGWESDLSRMKEQQMQGGGKVAETTMQMRFTRRRR